MTTWHCSDKVFPQAYRDITLFFYNISVTTYRIAQTPWACLCQNPIFFSLFLSGQVKLSGSSCRVSAPQGKDYFIMKPTHMLVLLLVWLPNGPAPKGARSLEVHSVGNTGRTEKKRGSVRNHLQIYCITEKLKWSVEERCRTCEIREICTGMYYDSRKTPDPPWEMSNPSGTHSASHACC